MRHRMTRLRILAVIALAGVGAVVGATASGSEGANASPKRATISSLRVGLEYNISTLDLTQSTSANNGILDLWSDQLVEFGRDGKPHPWLAQSVAQPNATTYVFHLRENVKFWDDNLRRPTWPTRSTTGDRTDRKPLTSSTASRASRRPAARPSDIVVDLIDEFGHHRHQLVRPAAAAAQVVVRQARHADHGHRAMAPRKPGSEHRSGLNREHELLARACQHRPHLDQLLCERDQHGGCISHRSDRSCLPLRRPGVPICLPGEDDLRAVTYPARHCDGHARASMERRSRPARGGVRAQPHGDQGCTCSAELLSDIIPPAELYAIAPRSAVNAMLARLPKYYYDPSLAKKEMAMSSHPNGFTVTLVTLQGFGFYNIAQVVAADLKPIGIKLNVRIVPIDQWLSLITGADLKVAGIATTRRVAPTMSVTSHHSSSARTIRKRAGSTLRTGHRRTSTISLFRGTVQRTG